MIDRSELRIAAWKGGGRFAVEMSGEDWRQALADLREVTEAIPVDRRKRSSRTLFWGYVGKRRFVVIREGLLLYASWRPDASPRFVRYLFSSSIMILYGAAAVGGPVLFERNLFVIALFALFFALCCGLAVYGNLRMLDRFVWTFRYLLDRSLPRDTPEPPKPTWRDWPKD